ncbi:PilZ domain-containing protein [bacterium]|nr:PilZ domain-containing protein [bacterium]
MSGENTSQDDSVAVAGEVETSPSQANEADGEVAAAIADVSEEELDPQSVWGAESEADKKSAAAAKSERRIAQRKGVRLNKLIMAQLVYAGESTGLYLHLVDISSGGIRVNGDVEFPQSEQFTLKLQTESFGGEVSSEYPEMEVNARVVWSKRLLGGMFVSGLQFLDMSDAAKACVAKILEICSPEGKRLRFRLNRVLGVGIGLEEQTRWLYPLALDLSVEGMRVRLDESLEIGSTFPLQIFLEFDLPTVHMNAEVVWRDEVGTGRYQVGLRFHDLNEDSAKAIQDYIDRCLAKEVQP